MKVPEIADLGGNPNGKRKYSNSFKWKHCWTVMSSIQIYLICIPLVSYFYDNLFPRPYWRPPKHLKNRLFFHHIFWRNFNQNGLASFSILLCSCHVLGSCLLKKSTIIILWSLNVALFFHQKQVTHDLKYILSPSCKQFRASTQRLYTKCVNFS